MGDDSIAAITVRRFTRDYTLATFPLGLLITVYYAIWIPLEPSASRVGVVLGNLILFAVYGAAFLLILFGWLRGYLRRTLGWLDGGRAVGDEDVRALRRAPWRIALFVPSTTPATTSWSRVRACWSVSSRRRRSCRPR
jgi:hypothetical protein